MFQLTPQERTVFVFIAAVLFAGSGWETVSKRCPPCRDLTAVLDGGMIYHKVDINTASKEELVAVPYIGDYTADKIIEFRTMKKISDINSLKSIKGIKEKNFEKFKMYLTVSKK